MQYTVVREPVSLPDTEALAEQDPYQFQWWALGLVGARPVKQKGSRVVACNHQCRPRIEAWLQATTRRRFHDEADDRAATKQIILLVKAGHTTESHVCDLWGVVETSPESPPLFSFVHLGYFSAPDFGDSSLMNARDFSITSSLIPMCPISG